MAQDQSQRQRQRRMGQELVPQGDWAQQQLPQRLGKTAGKRWRHCTMRTKCKWASSECNYNLQLQLQLQLQAAGCRLARVQAAKSAACLDWD
ncbi:GH22249 [Drosophila grimshawi]|uniref:GH22249 n=1 Tax=Drosophila grimshawi TaxID=7222 RepID=B4K0B2_DROGR|nr:GH22249 [Drosophila grimshawi]